MNSSSDVTRVLAALERAATQRDRDNLARFGITAKKAYGVSIANIQRIAKPLGRNHALATALWKTGWYEARLLTAFIDEPERVTPAQMDRGAAISTTGAFATRSAFTSSIARRMRGRRSSNGMTTRESSSSERRSRCWPALRCTTNAPLTNRSSEVSRSSSARPPTSGTL